MAFKYSSFISYRHNELDNTFFVNLKNFLSSEIFKVTNKDKAFYDVEAIDWGVQWDDKIYSGIEQSFFFLPVWYYHYLNENNLWCARELYHALEIEKVIKDQLDPNDKGNFVFIFPLIYRGNTDLIPQVFSKKAARSLSLYEIDIKNKKSTTRLQKFINEIYNSLLDRYLILEKYQNIDFQNLFQTIKKPTDEEIIQWIKDQKKIIQQKEAAQLPVLTKNGE